MNSQLTTLMGLGAFVLVTGVLTLAIVLLVLRGLMVQRRQRGHARQLAAQEGWRYAGHDEFSGQVGEREWRGGWQQDDDDGRRRTQFVGGVPGVSPGGFDVRLRSSWPPPPSIARDRDGSDDCSGWQAVEAGSAAFRQRWVLLASTPRWAAVWTPQVDTLWLSAHAVHPGEIRIRAEEHFLNVQRDDGTAEPTLDQVAALLRLGDALMQSTQAVARDATRS